MKQEDKITSISDCIKKVKNFGFEERVILVILPTIAWGLITLILISMTLNYMMTFGLVASFFALMKWILIICITIVVSPMVYAGFKNIGFGRI